MASAEKGEVALLAAHLAAHGGQIVIHIPPGKLGAQVAAAQALQTVLLPREKTWDKTWQKLKKHSDIKTVNTLSQRSPNVSIFSVFSNRVMDEQNLV